MCVTAGQRARRARGAAVHTEQVHRVPAHRLRAAGAVPPLHHRRRHPEHLRGVRLRQRHDTAAQPGHSHAAVNGSLRCSER